MTRQKHEVQGLLTTYQASLATTSSKPQSRVVGGVQSFRARIENTNTPTPTSICTRPTMERYTKPAGLNASIWATSPVSTISPTRTAPATTSPTKTNLGDKPLTIAQVPAGRPSELVRLCRTIPQTLPEAVEA